ncbi:MAG TPA: hypothetical protein PLE74_01265 [Candidatus Cloacimonadota bacterium]|nr:hypothetical protein [Candidatus Cloacimonadota bacterium]
MQDIYLLLDYRGNFGSKYTAVPYRSGMDKALLTEYFTALDYNPIFMSFTDIDLANDSYKDKIILYTSSEDEGHYYKSFIEDVILALELTGAIVIPNFKYLRAHDNKVFMEFLRNMSDLNEIKNIQSRGFGTWEELRKNISSLPIPCVIKKTAGAMSSGVTRALTKNELLKKTAVFSQSVHHKTDLLDMVRSYLHKGYVKNSTNRRKFIVQNFIGGLQNDWKVLIFGDKYYILYRGTRDNDFRASGSGKFVFTKEIPAGILDFALRIFQAMEVPCLSIDIAYDGHQFYLIEFQALYFGTTTIEKSPFYFAFNHSSWDLIEGKSILEKEYVSALHQYILDHVK